jgi:MFS family permease
MEPPTLFFGNATLGAREGTPAVPVSRWLMGALVIGLGYVFVKIEEQARNPILDFSLLKIRTFWAANLASFLTFIAYSSMNVLMPFFLEEVLKFSPEKAGLFMTAVPLTVFVVAPISGRISDRIGSQGITLLGALVGATGLFVMGGAFGLGIHERVSHPSILVGLCSIGLATGLFQSPNNSAIMGAVPLEKLGVASALLATIRNLGLVTGTSVSTGLFEWRRALTGDFVSALHFAFFFGGVVALGAMLASLGRKTEAKT